MAKNTVQGGNPVEPIHGFDGATTGEVIQSAVIVVPGTDNPVPSTVARGLSVDTSGAAMSSSRTTIATAGTPVQLSASPIGCKSVFVVALPTNTLRVAVGGVTVDAADSTFNGIPLEPTQGIGIDISNPQGIYLDVLGDGQGVTWTAMGL